MLKQITRPLAILAIGALTACGGGGSQATPVPLPPIARPAGTVIVGVGDSLTAGYQSGGLLGDPTVTSPLSAYPGGAVPPGQESGFFALFYQQATGAPSAAAAGVLPLIKGPGLGSQIVLNATTLIANTHLSCDAFNQQAYSLSTWSSTRLGNTNGTTDLGVPGITMHEAVTMHAPLTGPQTPNAAGTGCNPYPVLPGDPTSGALQSLVNGESDTFYPVLGSFSGQLGPNLTELNAALALSPNIATVWLGANDLLKYIFSAGLSPISDSPQQMATDLTQIVTSLKAGGAKVVVGDLPNVLTTPQFFPQAKFVPDIATMLVVASKGAIPPAAAGSYATGVSGALATNYGLTAGSYLTESGFFSVVSQAAALITANPAAPNFAAIQLDPSGKGTGLGGAYITPAFAVQVQTVNTAYNQAIDGVAASTGVALAPVTATFNTIATSGYAVGAQTMTLQFGGGLLGWDGLHPSNVGYAAIANLFIGAADTTYGLTIPQLSAAQIGAIAGSDPYNPAVIKAVNPLSPFPLP